MGDDRSEAESVGGDVSAEPGSSRGRHAETPSERLVEWRGLGRRIAVIAAGCAAIGLAAGILPKLSASMAAGVATLAFVAASVVTVAVAAAAGLSKAGDRLAGDDVGLMPTPARRAVAKRRRRQR
jgi:hypothetical protein